LQVRFCRREERLIHSFHASSQGRAAEDAGVQDPFIQSKKLGRPMSPHLSIYNWQLTNTMSILHRATGVAASVLFYAAMFGYAVAPATFAAGSVVSWMAGHSAILALTKAAIAVPVWYHTFNGIRHLVREVY
jgi:succinate dehydrogenase (ubiquinone) cytochrome b560 subunit